MVTQTQRIIRRNLTSRAKKIVKNMGFFNSINKAVKKKNKGKKEGVETYWRQTLGLYRKFARVDLEVRHQLQDLDPREGLSKVDVKALLA